MVTSWSFSCDIEYRIRLRCPNWQPVLHAACLACFILTLCWMKSCVSCHHWARGSLICFSRPFEDFVQCPPHLAISSSLHISRAELIRPKKRLSPLLSMCDLSYQYMQEANRGTAELDFIFRIFLVCWWEADLLQTCGTHLSPV